MDFKKNLRSQLSLQTCTPFLWEVESCNCSLKSELNSELFRAAPYLQLEKSNKKQGYSRKKISLGCEHNLTGRSVEN